MGFMSCSSTKNIVLASAMITGLMFLGCSSQEEVSPEINPLTSDAATAESENGTQVPDSTESHDPVVTEGNESEQSGMEDALAQRD